MKTLERLRQDWVLATEINKLEARIWRIARRENLKTIVVTSPVRGDGKSTTVAYLATYLGMYPDRRILAIDFDLRVPTLSEHFEIPLGGGLERVLEGHVGIHDVISETELPGLHLAVPSSGGADPTLLLRTREMQSAINEARESYDLILIDAPAIVPVADTTMILPFADGVILVGMAGKTTAPQLSRAHEICLGMDAKILGLVVGNVQEAAPEYLADDYNYYGYNRDRDQKGSGPSSGSPSHAGEDVAKGKKRRRSRKQSRN